MTRHSGSVFILALWVLFFLGALALAVSAHVSSSLSLARALKGDAAAYYLARAGVETALASALATTNAWDGVSTEAWNHGDDAFRSVPLKGGTFSVSYVPPAWDANDREPERCFGVLGEEACININKASEKLLASAFELLGGFDRRTALQLAQAVKTRRQVPDAGAGSDDDAHHGAFLSLDELRHLRGVTPKAFEKMAPHLTVFGNGRINVNAAGKPVLRCLGSAYPGPLEGQIRRVIKKRESNEVFRDEKAFAAGAFRNFLTTRSTCFRGRAQGTVWTAASGRGPWRIEPDPGNGEAVTRYVDFVFDRAQKTVVYWSEG